MNKTTDSTKLAKLQQLNTLLPHEIRGQSQVLPRIASAVLVMDRGTIAAGGAA